MQIHSMEHVNAVKATSYMLSSYFTSDTYANGHSARAARLAAGLCADLASAIMQGHARNGFALVRPPGHHAGLKQPMGFCLHNNAAVAALAAQAAGADRVLIVDWDVHHGNGTQEIFEGNRTIGGLGAEGYSVNIPWKCGGIGDNDYLFAFEQVVLPIALQFAPDFTIISAGFDAAQGDPLGGCSVFEDEQDATRYCDLLQGGGEGCEGVAELEASSVFDLCRKMRALAVLFRRGRTPPLPDNLKLNLKARKRSLEDNEELN
ncbi:histone deacetylase 15 [Nymphaea colorata]|nr:histone deacetylase 15 [Nymphaea colorata]